MFPILVWAFALAKPFLLVVRILLKNREEEIEDQRLMLMIPQEHTVAEIEEKLGVDSDDQMSEAATMFPKQYEKIIAILDIFAAWPKKDLSVVRGKNNDATIRIWFFSGHHICEYMKVVVSPNGSVNIIQKIQSGKEWTSLLFKDFWTKSEMEENTSTYLMILSEWRDRFINPCVRFQDIPPGGVFKIFGTHWYKLINNTATRFDTIRQFPQTMYVTPANKCRVQGLPSTRASSSARV